MNVIAKCKIAIFDDVELYAPGEIVNLLPGQPTPPKVARILTECGGDIITLDGDDYDQHSMDPINGYCDKCYMTYYYPYGVPV